MAVIKRNWKPLSLLAVVLAVVVLIVVQQGRRTEALMLQGGPQYTVPGEVERGQVDRLLAELVLDRDALIALNPSARQAEDLLAAVRTWNEQNRAARQPLADALAQKRVALRELRLSVRRGQAGENFKQELATAIGEVDTALGSYRAGTDSLRTQINTLLSPTQRATWQVIACGYGEKMSLRMLDLGGSQRLSVSTAQRKLESALGESENGDQRAAAIAQWQSDLDTILTQDQKTVVTAYQGYFVSASNTVTTVFDAVLPREG